MGIVYRNGETGKNHDSIAGIKEQANFSRIFSRTCSCSQARTEQEHEKFLILRTRTEREQVRFKPRTLFLTAALLFWQFMTMTRVSEK